MQSTLVRLTVLYNDFQQKTSKTLLNTSAKKDPRGNTSMKQMIDLGEDEEFAGAQGTEGAEGREIDPDALAFIHAKRHVDDIQKAKKFEKRIGAHN